MAAYNFIDHKFDVVVVGAGGSGLRAALLILNLFVCGLAGALAIFSILKVAFGGGAY